MKVCKICGEENSNDSLFCCNCGSSAFLFKEEVACPHCGAPNVVKNEYCTNCGGLIAAVDSDNSSQQSVDSIGAIQPTDAHVAANGGYTLVASQDTVACPKCGKQVPITAVFCNHCGESVIALNNHKSVRRRICPTCGKPNPMEAAYCKHCFASLAEGELTDMQVTFEHSYCGDTVVQQAMLSNLDGKTKVCPNCGALNDPDEDFCVSCGLKLCVEDVKKYCPNCGAENPSDTNFCSNCQWSFSGQLPDQINNWKCPVCGSVNDQADLFCSDCGTAKQQSESNSEVKHE